MGCYKKDDEDRTVKGDVLPALCVCAVVLILSVLGLVLDFGDSAYDREGRSYDSTGFTVMQLSSDDDWVGETTAFDTLKTVLILHAVNGGLVIVAIAGNSFCIPSDLFRLIETIFPIFFLPIGLLSIASVSWSASTFASKSRRYTFGPAYYIAIIDILIGLIYAAYHLSRTYTFRQPTQNFKYYKAFTQEVAPDKDNHDNRPQGANPSNNNTGTI